jgi:hypothetical protein
MDPKVIMKAIRDKQIAGKIDKDEDDDEDTPEITDTTEGIVRYLEAHADECYPKKSDYTMTFKRKI